jgi:hypothetical protein
MPDVKPQWIDDRDLHSEDICDCPVGNKKLVLTLDQIEAWLKEQKTFYQARARQGLDVRQSCATIDDLLAQVQAWKQNGSTKSS